MKMRVIKKIAQHTAVWAGGTTTELAIWPQGASYAARNFAWRISTDSIDLSESHFTPMPNYHRIFMLLDGEIHLSHGFPDGKILEMDLHPFEPVEFDGAWRTVSRGRCVDFNIMLNENANWRGMLILSRAKRGPDRHLSVPCTFVTFYCLRDNVDIEVQNKQTGMSRRFLLDAGDFLLVEFESLDKIGQGVGLRVGTPSDAENEVLGVMAVLGQQE